MPIDDDSQPGEYDDNLMVECPECDAEVMTIAELRVTKVPVACSECGEDIDREEALASASEAEDEINAGLERAARKLES
jgi:endogenous inhibitor of DNA gyrase (YacG/DUF329 family)